MSLRGIRDDICMAACIVYFVLRYSFSRKYRTEVDDALNTLSNYDNWLGLPR
jgi:hypothetical protein